MMLDYIYHITTQASWQQAAKDGFYTHPSLTIEGFIHCSKAHQVEGVLKRYFNGVNNLVKLTINPHKLKALLQYDFSPSINEDFPHIYGKLNVDAVELIEPINTAE
jgi:uncharacterized protein (DUF952 family)